MFFFFFFFFFKQKTAYEMVMSDWSSDVCSSDLYQLPTEDRFLLTRSELEDRIAVLLGGRVAEELVYGEISTGAHNDLERASGLARMMVTKYGMSERVGLATYGERAPLFLRGAGNGMGGERDYSEETARI